MASHPASPTGKTSAIDISRPPTPATPPAHISPSFDYHEERRLHLQDEIYFSHRLPRLPPPALDSPSAPRSPSRTYDASTGLPARARANNISADASPSAFHPAAPFTQMRSLSLDEDEEQGEDSATRPNLHFGRRDGSYEGMPGGSQFLNGQLTGATAPSSLPPSDADAVTKLLKRREQDAQERLDLEEEKRERLLAEAPAGQTQAAGMAASMLQGESSVLPPDEDRRGVPFLSPLSPACSGRAHLGETLLQTFVHFCTCSSFHIPYHVPSLSSFEAALDVGDSRRGRAI